MASDYTDALAIKAAQLVFKYLPRAYKDGSDREAREKLHNASCIAGMAFTNAFLGINHALAHKLGGEFNIPHGRANAIMLPHVIRYNSQIPSKFAIFPKYGHYVAPEKYAELANAVGLRFRSVSEGIEKLIQAIINLQAELNVPSSISAAGVSKEGFENKVSRLAEEAFQDQTITANPRSPLISELKELYLKAF
jgi:acetaldehyde dehydrogenase/alcohol dehydrogenase